MSETALDTTPVSGASRALALPLVLRIALRDLRTGITGFSVFIICIALGVAAIAGIGSLAGALTQGLAREGQRILGGDFSASLVHRRASQQQRAFFEANGTLSEIATLRAMARRSGESGGSNTLVRIKATDGHYPLYGRVGLAKGDETSFRSGHTAVAEQLLLERLKIKLGDTVRIGEAEIRITGILTHEPDQLATTRLAVGPRLIMSLDALQATGLIQPGSLMRWHYRLKLSDADVEKLILLRKKFETRFADAGFTIRDRRDPNPRITRIINRVAQFLTLAGIATLMIGGVGVANAITAYLARKRATIAVFKCLGASGGTIFRIYLIEVLLLAGAGTALGLATGAAFPLLAAAIAGEGLPVRLETGLHPPALLLGAIYGLMTALVFVLWPLGHARDVPATMLLRQTVSGERSRPAMPFVIASALCAFILAGVAVAGAESRLIASWAMAGLVVIFAVYLGIGIGIEKIARMLPRPRRTEVALAKASLAGPGGFARPVILSLGASLSLLAAVSLVNASLTAEFKSSLPDDAPSYYILDIPREGIEEFSALVRETEPEAKLQHAPMLRGRIVRLKEIAAKDVSATPNAKWVLNGDRGLTYAADVPEGSKLVAGEWWDKNYDGPPLVSFEADIAKGLGLAIGDTVTINVLGRPVEAKIANLREVDWDSLAINFVMVFSPNTLRSAPHNFLATIKLPPEADAVREAALAQTIGAHFPAVTALRVRDAIQAFGEIAARVMTAIRAASGFTLIVGAVVLAGALSVAHPRRIRESVIFKTLGATRRQIVMTHLIEYGILALVAGSIAALIGTMSAWAIVTRVMDSPFTFSLGAVLQPILLATALVLLFGTIGSWRVLGASTAHQLRQG